MHQRGRGGRGRGRFNSTTTPHQGSNYSQNSLEIICSNCKGKGHVAQVCPTPRRNTHNSVNYNPSPNHTPISTQPGQNWSMNSGTTHHLNAIVDGPRLVPISHVAKILVIGATGYVGKYMVEASIKANHPTFALIRESTLSNPAKSQELDGLKNLGVNFLTGDLNDQQSLVNAVRQVDIVISTVGRHLLLDQKNIIAAIKQTGNVKRFIPSEYGNDSDRVHAVDPAKTVYANKAIIRRAIEAEGIPYTYVSSNFFARHVLPTLAQPGASAPPREKAFIFGDGIPKAVINTEEDVASYTIKAAVDPRAMNKILYIKPAGNIYSFNDLVSLWENKIGKTLERVYIPEAQVLKKIEGAGVPLNMYLSLGHSGFVKGDHTNFVIDPSIGVEASQLYPEFKYTSVDKFLSQFV
jgi:uncharacterized protein YbjT (DUF2867 family)